MDEIWKPVVGYEAYYAVSNRGRVKSLARVAFKSWKFAGVVGQHYGEKILKTRLHKKYLQLDFRVDKVRKTFVVHRLVAEAFLPNPEVLPEVDHKNANRFDNSVGNLEWVTEEENRRRAARIGLMSGKKPLVATSFFVDRIAA